MVGWLVVVVVAVNSQLTEGSDHWLLRAKQTSLLETDLPVELNEPH